MRNTFDIQIFLAGNNQKIFVKAICIDLYSHHLIETNCVFLLIYCNFKNENEFHNVNYNVTHIKIEY